MCTMFTLLLWQVTPFQQRTCGRQNDGKVYHISATWPFQGKIFDFSYKAQCFDKEFHQKDMWRNHEAFSF